MVYLTIFAMALASQLDCLAAVRMGKHAGMLQQAEVEAAAAYEASAEAAAQEVSAEREDQEGEELLDKPKQTRRSAKKRAPKNETDLAFMHIPYNFGHTIEAHAIFPSWLLPSVSKGVNSHNPMSGKILAMNFTQALANRLRLFYKREHQFWGHLNPELNTISEVTGCYMYYTPQKYWPEELASKYFGKNKTIFGMIRSPYERLSAFFRGEFANYGGAFPEYYKSCDVNGAIKALMKEVLQTNNTFQKNCTMLPQAEYFDGKYGINFPLDSKKFPRNANEMFAAHNFPVKLRQNHIIHVAGCDDAWSGSFDAETKQLIRTVFKRDFELLCKLFGYCDELEDSCMQGVMHMCPESLFTWDKKAEEYVRKK